MSTTISGTSGVTFPDSTSMQTGQQACKAWVNFNGTGTVAIRGSYNVSSITDNATADYTVNFTNAMPDANYATCLNTVTLYNGSADCYSQSAGAYVAGSVRVLTFGTNQAAIDASVVSVAIFSN